LSVLGSLKEKYEQLYQAIEEYQQANDDKTKRHVMAIANAALQIGSDLVVSHCFSPSPYCR
jgi:hypothetical protein